MNNGDTKEHQERCFLGRHECSVDAQRRLAVPSSWRGDGACFYLLPGRGHSIQMIPDWSFQSLVEKLRKVSFADGQAARALAQIGSIAQEVRCDKQGRITLSPDLVNYAGLKGRALLLGSVTFAQIYAPETWQDQQMSTDACLDVIQRIQEQPDDLTNILRTAAGN
ncbi:MAG: division/cell wall cluster transcriptional repressor MraZ [Verrucomicrobiota bacterium]